MNSAVKYTPDEPDVEEVRQSRGPLVLEFGTNWCGHCQGAQNHIESAFESAPDVQHQKIEDGKGRPLGRAFKVKLWPTLIFLRDGEEIERVVRPTDTNSIARALARITK